MVVAVIGAGPAGLHLGASLVRRGHRAEDGRRAKQEAQREETNEREGATELLHQLFD